MTYNIGGGVYCVAPGEVDDEEDDSGEGIYECRLDEDSAQLRPPKTIADRRPTRGFREVPGRGTMDGVDAI